MRSERGPSEPTTTARSRVLRFLAILCSTLSTVCSVDEGGPRDPSDAGRPEATVCARLAPVAHTEPVFTVGTGTAASCTEEALREAIAGVSAARGGTVTFECGGSHTFELGSALIVDTGGSGDGGAPVVVDGGGEIILSGSGVTRLFDLSHYTRFVIQRITLRDGFVAEESDGDPPQLGRGHPAPLVWDPDRYRRPLREQPMREPRRRGRRRGRVRRRALAGRVLGLHLREQPRLQRRRPAQPGEHTHHHRHGVRGNGALGVGDGQYGNGGGVYIDGMNYDDPGDLYVCGATFEENTATQHGSGMFSYFYEGSSSTIELSVFEGNAFADPSRGSGALYHEGVHLDLRSTTLANHRSGEHAGGLFLASGSSATITNSTFANNRVTGNGAGIFDGASTAEIVNCTFTGNDADYGPAIFKGQSASITLRNTLMVDNTTANPFSATSCHEALIDGGGNMQWPETRANGNPDQPCVAGIRFADPLLLPLAANGGVGQTAALSPGSPAIDYGSNCPPTDQRGVARVGHCDSGAYQYEP